MAMLPGKFIWFEHVSGDQSGARSFYNALFGWSATDMPMGDQTYTVIQNGADAIAGYRTAPAGVPSHWMGYMSVADVDASCTRAVAAGATVRMPPTDFPGAGRGAALTDPQGAAFSLWRSKDDDGPDPEQAPVGSFTWHELMTSDVAAALTFYKTAFGYASEAMPMPDFEYHLLSSGGRMRAGLMQCTEPGMPPNWTPYVAVADCDACLARVPALGGTVCVPATDIPNVGRFGVLADPQGAVLGILRMDA